MRIVFFGTPDFAVESLRALLDNDYEVVAVVTAPDRPAGRGHKLLPSAVKTFAESKNLPILQPINLKSEEFLRELRSLNPDIQIVVAFRMLPEVVWDMPPLGTFNVHASLLPNYRGAAPINWAIINGETETGVTTFKLQHEIDTGSILKQRRTSIGKNETFGELYPRLMSLGAELLVESMQALESGNYDLIPQTTQDSNKKAPKIFKNDCEIDWRKTKKEVHDFVRGLSPFPGAFSYYDIDHSTDRIKISRVRPIESESSGRPGIVELRDAQILIACSDGYVEVLELQMPGKRVQTSEEFVRGNKDFLESVQLKLK